MQFWLGLFLSIFLFPVNAGAELPTQQPWVCSMTMRVVGNSPHFVTYGRDSWEGTSTLFCQQGGTTRTRRVTLTFNAFPDGFGAGANSQLTLTISLTTAVDPHILQVRTFVVNREAPNTPARWNFTTGKTSGTISVSRVDQSEIARSLQRGTLYLRSALE